MNPKPIAASSTAASSTAAPVEQSAPPSKRSIAAPDLPPVSPVSREVKRDAPLLVAGAKRGPHAIEPEQEGSSEEGRGESTDERSEGSERILRDVHLGEVSQSQGIFGARGLFAADGGSPLCGITSVMNAITKFRRDWGLPSRFEDQAHEQLFLMETFLPMIGLDAHQDVIDHGTSSVHFERAVRAYLRDQLGLVPTTEWIRRRADHVPAALREAFFSGMAVAASVSFTDRGGGHWILLGGAGRDDGFFVCDPNYPRPLWGSQLRAVPVPGGSQSRMKATPTGDYVFTDLLAIGARGEAPAEIARVRYRHRGVELTLSVAPDGWARLEAAVPGGPKVLRCGEVSRESIAKLTKAIGERSAQRAKRAEAGARATPERAPLMGGATELALDELDGPSQRRARAALDEMAGVLLRTESPPFKSMHLERGERSIRVQDGTLVVEGPEGRSERRLSLIELELLSEATRRAKMRPTRGSQIAPIPKELPIHDGRAPDFSIGVAPSRSKAYASDIGIYGGSTSGRFGDYGELHDRLDPLLRMLDRLGHSELPRAVRNTNTPRAFPVIGSRKEWEARAQQIRQQVLVSTGLWPLPEKTPLSAQVFGKIEREDYTIEKVVLQPFPGFYVAGNLYRPKGEGPFPAVLNPHGHWANGRLAHEASGSIQGRCIGFARQGFVAFSYDMVGYNDSRQIEAHDRFASDPTNQLWSINAAGLQTWNSIRALDFLSSLPDVDPSRIGCTGESGGGTQTYLLGAVDDRVAMQAPVCMVSHSFQGGCSCENPPGLRVDFSNPELTAAFAPRPQLLLGATGDWTKDTGSVEGPAIEKIYRLLQAEGDFTFETHDAGHNYDPQSCETAYREFGIHLRGEPRESFHPHVDEFRTLRMPKDSELLAFADGPPADALDEAGIIEALKARTRAQLEHTTRAQLLPAYERTLQVDLKQKVDRAPGVWMRPKTESERSVVVMAGGDRELAKQLVERGHPVLLIDMAPSGRSAEGYFQNFYTTYNRTDAQERVRDLIGACNYARSEGRSVTLVGAGHPAGLWCMLAAPAADAVVADCGAVDLTRDEALMTRDLFVPGIRNLGGFEGVAKLGAQRALLLHNTAGAAAIQRLDTEALADRIALIDG